MITIGIASDNFRHDDRSLKYVFEWCRRNDCNTVELNTVNGEDFFEALSRWIDLIESEWMGSVAGLALILMGIIQWRRGGHTHGPEGHSHVEAGDADNPGGRGLWGIAIFAFALGFAHEEEFAIVALCAGRANCWGVMAVYAFAVAGVILALTLVSVAAFHRFRERLDPWGRRLPRVSAVILIAMGIAYAVGWL